MNKKWKNIKLKSSGDKNEIVVFTENAIKIIQNKQILDTFLYPEILQIDISLSVFKFNGGRKPFAISNNYPDMYDLPLYIDIKTKDFDKYTLCLKSSLRTAFELVKLNNYIKKLNFKVEEEACIKNCVTIPLTFYALNGTKLNILGKPFSIIELLLLIIIFIPLLFIFLPSYISGNLSYNYVFFIFFPIIAIFISILGIINEIKKRNLRKNIFQDIVSSEKEVTTQFGDIQNYIITNNKVNISKECYKYINTNRYLSLLLFLLNLFLIMFTMLKVFVY